MLQTKTHQSAGLKPVWNETFSLPLNLTGDQITAQSGIVFAVVDEDITEHDLVGETALIPIKDLCQEKSSTFKLLFAGKEAGNVIVDHKLVIE